MKKRLRKTGEIVDVVGYYKYSSTIRNRDVDWVSYIDSNGVEHEKVDINIYWDFEDVEEELTKEIDWGERRYEVAKAAMVGLMAGHNAIYESKRLASVAMEYADALITELKEGEGL